MNVWGSRVWVHSDRGTKLDGRAKKGRWVGFDDESKGHRIYWEGKWSVTVKWSVRFVPNEVSGGWDMPLEGELEDFEEQEPPEASDNPTPVENRPISPIPESTIKEVVNELPSQPLEPSEPAKNEGGHGKRIHKESAYV